MLVVDATIQIQLMERALERARSPTSLSCRLETGAQRPPWAPSRGVWPLLVNLCAGRASNQVTREHDLSLVIDFTLTTSSIQGAVETRNPSTITTTTAAAGAEKNTNSRPELAGQRRCVDALEQFAQLGATLRRISDEFEASRRDRGPTGPFGAA